MGFCQRRPGTLLPTFFSLSYFFFPTFKLTLSLANQGPRLSLPWTSQLIEALTLGPENVNFWHVCRFTVQLWATPPTWDAPPTTCA